jgi:uncharacterized protein YigA (DUF484 family)
MDFGLADDDEMDAVSMDGVTAGLSEVKLNEDTNKEKDLEVGGDVIPVQEEAGRENEEVAEKTHAVDDVAEKTHAVEDVAKKIDEGQMSSFEEDNPTPKEAELMLVKKKRNKWGSVLPVRKSERINRDGKTTLDKATSLLDIKNLEKTSGKNSKLLKQSFASICSSTLVEKSKVG